MEEGGTEYQQKSSVYDQIASLADRNVLQVDNLEQSIAKIQTEKESLEKEIGVLQKKLKHSVEAVEDAQIAFLNTKSSINQLKQDVLVKKENNSKSSLAISALSKEIQDTWRLIEEKRSQFIDRYESFSQEFSRLPLFSKDITDKLFNGSIAGE